MKAYIMCGVFGCFEIYEAHHQHAQCPRCGISRADIIAYGTNDREAIRVKMMSCLDKDWEDLYNDALGG